MWPITSGKICYSRFCNYIEDYCNCITVIILIQHNMLKKISILTFARFSGKGRQSLINLKLTRMLISYVKLDHA